MPIPKPHKSEQQDIFILRCMGNGTMMDEYPDQAQRSAICHQSWRDRNKAQTIHNVRCHAAEAYDVRYETYNGTRHVVVPVVMMVEGVHHGSAGPIFYPADELAKFAASWNGRPVPVFHPEQDGYAVSCNDPQMIQQRAVGQLFNTYWDGTKLRSEAWIDPEKANKVYPGLISMVMAKQKIEVSTGLWSDDETTPGTWNNEQFNTIARNIRPDHLALLPGGQGACGWEDGCGVRANESKIQGGNDVKVLQKARNPAYGSKESIRWEEVDKSIKSFVDGFYIHTDADRPVQLARALEEMPTEMREWVAAKSLLGDPKADTWEGLCCLPVVNPTTNALNEDALAGIESILGTSKAIPDIAKSTAALKANGLLRREFGVQEPDRKVLGNVVRALAKFVGIKVQEDVSYDVIREMLQAEVDKLDHPPQPQPGMLHIVRDVYEDYFVYAGFPAEGPGSGDRKLWKQDYKITDGKPEMVGDPVEVREQTNYVKVKAQETVNDNLKQKPPVDGELKPTKEVKENMERKDQVAELIKNGHFCEKNQDWLIVMEQSQFDAIVALAAKGEKKEEPSKALEAPKEEPKKNEGSSPAEPPKETELPKPPTFNEVLASADQETREVIEEGRKLGIAKREALVKAILTNKRNKFTEDQLKSRPLDELSAMAELAGGDVNFAANTGGARPTPTEEPKYEQPEMKWNWVPGKGAAPDFSHLNK